MVAPQDIAWGRTDLARSEKLDPVAAWIAGSGQPFSRYLTSGDGFGFIAAIDAAELDADLDPGTSLVAVSNGAVIDAIRDRSARGTRGGGSANAAFDAAKLGMEDPRVMLVPLRAESVNPEVSRNDAVVRGRRADDGASGNRPAHAPRAVVGIVDHAINFAHPDFRTRDGTRVAFAWVQDGDWGGRPDLPFGREYTKGEIDLATGQSGGDEELLLRTLRLVDFSRPDVQSLALRASHGTHVLSLLAGPRRDHPRTRGADAALPEDVAIVSVTLPRLVARETAGTLLGVYFLQGLEYILDRAKDLAPRGPDGRIDRSSGLPVFVNFSFGLTGGPRRGRHLLERGMARLVRRYEEETGGSVTIALPAGNRALDRGHAAMRLGPAPPSFDIGWLLQPGDPTSNYLDIWIAAPEGELLGPALTLSLTPPGARAPIAGTLAVDRDPDAASRVRLRGNDAIGRAALRREGPDLLHLSVALAPTDPGATGRRPAPPGAWGVSVGGISAAAGQEIEVNAWILRDDVVPGFPDAGRQSRFVDPAYQRWTDTGFPRIEDPVPTASLVRRAGTLNALATVTDTDASSGSRRLTVGGRVGFASSAPEGGGTVAPYCGQPLPADTILAGADSTERITHEATTDRSPAAPGVLGAGTRGGSCVAINGTSVAAPQALRRVMRATLGLAPEDRAS